MCNHHTTQIDLNIDTSILKPLYKTKPIIHAIAIVYNWLIIAAAIYLGLYFSHPSAYVVSVFVVGARMHALAILMHDAAHFRFLRSKFWNDTISNVSIMYPIFTSIEVYRENHLAHHRHLNTDHDPDWVAKLGNRHFTFPKTITEFFITLFSYLVLYQGFMDAIWFLKRFGKAKQKHANYNGQQYIKIGFYIILISVLSVIGGWKIFLLYWVVPYFSTFFMYQYIRSVAEHFGDMAYENDLSNSRTTKANLIEKFFIAPHNVCYHLDHHLYPGIPFYNLPKLHDVLMAQEAYRKDAHITIGYTKGLLSELSIKPEASRLLKKPA